MGEHVIAAEHRIDAGLDRIPAWKRKIHALAENMLVAGFEARKPVQFIRPHARRVDEHLGCDLVFRAGEFVIQPNPPQAVA